ncbi:hypothetical protein HPB51_006123 [Rhipicephalus microplus]|uniref:Uncharacterized protein n=1 Tax=Rhipicephalus microplus TaxID=6941 RepID=A0A9J6ER48_RHIMP|nr:hypothetical protein HPB51_006123 [Rhipicephalus microplus]
MPPVFHHSPDQLREMSTVIAVPKPRRRREFQTKVPLFRPKDSAASNAPLPSNTLANLPELFALLTTTQKEAERLCSGPSQNEGVQVDTAVLRSEEQGSQQHGAAFLHASEPSGTPDPSLDDTTGGRSRSWLVPPSPVHRETIPFTRHCPALVTYIDAAAGTSVAEQADRRRPSLAWRCQDF